MLELILALGLVAAVFAAVTIWSAQKVDRARVHRLEEELATARRATAGARRVDIEEPPEEPRDEPLVPGIAAEGRQRGGEDLSQVRQLVERALQALRAHATPGAAVEEARRELRVIAQKGRRLEARLAAVLESGSEQLGAAPAFDSPPPEGPTLTTGSHPSEAISAAAEALERLSDESLELPEEIRAATRSAARTAAAAGTLEAALSAVERRAEAVTALSPAVLAVANRLNLLALDLAVVAESTEPADRRPGEELGGELRSAYEEVRRLARDLDTSAQRLADATRAAREACGEAIDAAAEGQDRAEKAGQKLARLPQSIGGLASQLAAAREAIRGLEEAHRGSLSRIRALGERVGEVAAAGVSAHTSAAAFQAQVRSLSAPVTELREAAERLLAALGETEAISRAEASGDLEAALRHLAS